MGVGLTSIAIFPVLISLGVNNLTNGILNTFVVALVLGIALRALGVFGVLGIAGFSALAGKLLGYSVPMAVAIGLTSLYGFPGTMILSQEAAKGAGENPEEVAAIENYILPKMIVAGFSTVTITSVIVTSIIAGRIGG